jgi:uncharacterized protein (TIGR02246 family)
MRLAVLVGAMVLAATAASAPQKSADEAAIAKVRSAYQTAAGTQDGPALAKLYAPDGVEMPPNAPAVKGRAAIDAFHKAFGQQWMMHGITITATETKIAGDTAIDTGTYKQQLMAQKGGWIFDDKGKYVVVMKKDAGGNWLITHAIYNSDVPPPVPPAAKK